jgi:hypothetical protein
MSEASRQSYVSQLPRSSPPSFLRDYLLQAGRLPCIQSHTRRPPRLKPCKVAGRHPHRDENSEERNACTERATIAGLIGSSRASPLRF